VVLRHALTSDLPLTPWVLARAVSACGAIRLTRAQRLFVQGYPRTVLARRLLLLAAVLMLLAVVAAGLAPQPADEAPPVTRSQLPAGGEVDEEISTADSNARVSVRRGDVLRLTVTGDAPDSVLLERLDRIESVEESTPARFELLADAPAGIYPIRLIDADRRIGTIEIRN
jgi:hypothetical protein